jgi:hypothetical protein
MIRTLLMVSVVCVLSGCVGAPPLDYSANAATLEFVTTDASADTIVKRGDFVSVDGLTLKNITHMLSIKPGKRSVGYMCAIILDGPPPPVVTMRFEPQQHYTFQCTGQFKAIVKLQ